MYFLTTSAVIRPASAFLGFCTSDPRSLAASKCLSGHMGAGESKKSRITPISRYSHNHLVAKFLESQCSVFLMYWMYCICRNVMMYLALGLLTKRHLTRQIFIQSGEWVKCTMVKCSRAKVKYRYTKHAILEIQHTNLSSCTLVGHEMGKSWGLPVKLKTAGAVMTTESPWGMMANSLV